MPEQITSQIGRYRIVGVVGQWERGWRCRGRDDLLGRDVLIKIWSQPGVVDTEALLARFRGAMVSPPVVSPNIIKVFEFGESEGASYVVFEWLEGKSLLEAMKAGSSLQRSLPFILQVLGGLACVHAAGIVHCDIKPANIFIQDDGPVKIMNLGGSRLIAHSVTLPAEGMILGTADYMSPEQVEGKPVDGRSDLFSVGCVLFELVTGHRPFHDDGLMAIFYGITHEEPNDDRLPSGPEWKRLRGVITRALEKKPEDRYPDAHAMRADLELALKELGDSAEWTPPAPRDAAGKRLY